MKDGHELRITRQSRHTYFIKTFEDEVINDVAFLYIADALFGKPYLWDRHGSYHSWPQKVIIKIKNQWYKIPEGQPTLVNKSGLSTTPHPWRYNISWMKDGQELRITRQCRLTYCINPFEY